MTPWIRDESALGLASVVEAFAEHGRGLKLDLKDGPSILDEVLALLDQHGLGDDDLWFNAGIEALGADGFRTLRSSYPGAIVQCPIDFLAPLVLAEPRQAQAVLRGLASWGITRFSIAWGREHTRPLLERLDDWGHEVNLYAVPDLDSFLEAVLLLPDSLTADFNFPDWNSYGRGSGESRRYHRYRVHEVAASQTDGVATGRTAEKSTRRGGPSYPPMRSDRAAGLGLRDTTGPVSRSVVTPGRLATSKAESVSLASSATPRRCTTRAACHVVEGEPGREVAVSRN